ncbi:MAG: response regulator transcription factor [Bacteroidales bacterium]|nr:response regulator transcription factor [Bacteroidales bacterium]MCF8351436.1 response regulator transcription factor [Bacteroidales bacterium]MCF8374779.1 response regulator transcription factor [Bacteroidales bacterium]MCF8399817.1 response regulator transcription factor [Bacteroidales bacterium]
MRGGGIIIAENFYLIRKGLIALLESLDTPLRIHEAADWESTRDLMVRYSVNMIIINPELIPDAKTELHSLKMSHHIITLMAIDKGNLSDNIKKHFDEIISISGNKSELITRLRNFIGQKKREGEKTNNTGLSIRETDILKLVARGYTNQEIADQLFISTHTVISHRKNIVSKLGIKTVAGLTVYALLNNLINMDDAR